MRGKIFALALAVLFSISFACNASFYKDVNVRVVDEGYRPIQDAFVSVYYQVSYSVQENGRPIYSYSNEKLTDFHGFATIGIQNKEQDKSKVDCKIKVKVKKFNYGIEKQFDLDDAPYEILIKIPAHKLTVRTIDEFSNKLDSRIIINNQTFNSTGNSFFMLPDGKYDVFVAHKYNKKFFEINIKEDLPLDVSFNYVPVDIKVYDDRGNLMDYQLHIEEEEFTSENGTIYQLLSGNFDAVIETSKGRKTARIDTASKKDYSFIYDINPPVFSQVSFITKDGKTYIKSDIADEGKYASGVAKVFAVLVFENENSYSIPLENDYYNNYVGAVDQTGSLFFELTAEDREGNTATARGDYKYASQPGLGQDPKENAPKKEEKGFFETALDLVIENLVAVAVIIVVAGFAVYKLSKKAEEELSS